ncbi:MULTISPECIES: Rmf/CrpP fold protein [unclassified Streptomyces]|uniref:Ribosome modulation factor n=1 Tax=Streptomyces sp. NBC_00060 TaxID=2975636 RepID=A0AAU2HCH5_9ACTN
MGFREDTVRARQAGYTAARAGRPLTDCPHSADSLLRLAWVRGYKAAHPPSVEVTD